MKRILVALLFLLCAPSWATTWYVRADGGSRYSSNVTSGQCNGQADAPYPGKGYNQPCAFNDVRYLWADGSYTVGSGFPGWGWIIAGGDKVILRDGPWRIGASGPNIGDWRLGLVGNPYESGPPQIPSGTEAAHTQILGEHYGSCSSASARTGIYGGYGVNSVLQLAGTSYVDVSCLDITDHSSCGRSSQLHQCNRNFPLDDYATVGITTDRNSTRDSVTNVGIHGMASTGWFGSTGDGFVASNVDLLGNPSAGWNADAGDGQTGTGTLTVSYMNIGWSGCAEEYPITHQLPYSDCTDDNVGGYGDGFGTATVASSPAWHVSFDHSSFFNNTQDGLDALHLTGNGSSLTVTNSLAYGNMGQQFKVGASSTFINNVAYGSCNAMHQNIPGTPDGFNARLSDFCRAADTTIAITVDDSAPTIIQNNTVYSAQATTWQVECQSHCGSSAILKFQNNLFLGFMNDSSTGYSRGTGYYSNPLYIDSGGVPSTIFSNAGSVDSNNAVYHAKFTWKCGEDDPAAYCGDPQLADESWHMYGYGDVRPASSTSAVIGRGAAIAALASDFAGVARSANPTIGAFEYSSGSFVGAAPVVIPPDTSSTSATSSSSDSGSTASTTSSTGTTGSTDSSSSTSTSTGATSSTTAAPGTAAPSSSTDTSSDTGQTTTGTKLDPTQWTKVASENQTVLVPAGTSVRYGIGSSYIYAKFSNATTVAASNGYFGNDPAVGVVKELDVLGASSVVVQ